MIELRGEWWEIVLAFMFAGIAERVGRGIYDGSKWLVKFWLERL